MIDEAILADMEKQWGKHGFVYQGRKRSLLKLQHFEKYSCPLLKGKDVLELACNAGVFGYLISQYANSYTGVEPGQLIHKKKDNIDYFAQTAVTAKYIENKNISFINDTVGGFFRNDRGTVYNALVVCFALYRFSDKEIGMIRDMAFPRCDVVCIQNRNTKHKKRNSYNLYETENIGNLLIKGGYGVTRYDFNDGVFSEIIGVR
jgi:hypothetical protein